MQAQRSFESGSTSRFLPSEKSINIDEQQQDIVLKDAASPLESNTSTADDHQQIITAVQPDFSLLNLTPHIMFQVLDLHLIAK
jgi:hypothetical protein